MVVCNFEKMGLVVVFLSVCWCVHLHLKVAAGEKEKNRGKFMVGLSHFLVNKGLSCNLITQIEIHGATSVAIIVIAFCSIITSRDIGKLCKSWI